jgi:hypothetical protein
MMITDTALLSAFVSAAVALLIVILKEFVLEPRRKRTENKLLKKRLISAWISDMKSNVNSLRDRQHRLDKLVYDDRPLDRIALCRSDVAKTMTDTRSRIKDLNELVEVYNAVLAPQIRYLLMPDPRKAEPYAPQLGETGEIDTSLQIKKWRDDWLDLIDKRRNEILPQIEKLIDLLEHADDMNC